MMKKQSEFIEGGVHYKHSRQHYHASPHGYHWWAIKIFVMMPSSPMRENT